MLRPGDVLLLASDGLTGMLEDEHLAAILQAEGGPQQWVDRMINDANRRGGLDNITAIIIRIEQDVPREGSEIRIDVLGTWDECVEAKVEGSQTTVARQLRDYASRPDLQAVVLITARAQHAIYMPQEFAGKPVIVLLATGGV